MKQSNRDEFVAGAFYHFYNRSADRKTVFLNDEDFDFFLNRYQYYFNPIIDTYAFCLMKNHFHFVIRLKQEHVIRQYAETQSGSRPLEYLGNVISLDGYLQDQFKRFFSSVSIKLN